MFLDIRELQREKLFFEERFLPGRIGYGNEVSQVEPLETSGSAELVATEIRLRGHLRTVMEVCCARCLEPTRQVVELDFDLFYRPVQTIAREEEVEIKPAELEVGFYQGQGLMLEDALKEQVLLALPMKTICRPDCAGLCPQCGQNRNVAACGCREVSADNRWASLAEFQK
jgi:uncharacterized protein